MRSDQESSRGISPIGAQHLRRGTPAASHSAGFARRDREVKDIIPRDLGVQRSEGDAHLFRAELMIRDLPEERPTSSGSAGYGGTRLKALVRGIVGEIGGPVGPKARARISIDPERPHLG